MPDETRVKGAARIRAGTILGPYKVDKRLGSGGSGDVWRVNDESGRPLAMKIQSIDDAQSELSTSKFLAECLLLQRVDHPNVVRHFAHGQHGGSLYAVMELIEGVPLRNFIPLPPQDTGPRLHPVRALAVGIDVACGLAAAHAMGVVHRDVKPENVMVTIDLAKVIDFGIGKFSRDVVAARTSSIPEDRRFSPSCSAPEYLEVPPHCQGPGCLEPPASCSCACPACASPDFDDPRLDVYSLGILVWNMLAGQHPFRDAQGDAAKMITAHRERVPPSLASRGFPGYLDDVLDPALAKSPGARYSRMLLFASSLLNVLGELSRDVSSKRIKIQGPEAPRVDFAAVRARYELTALMVRKAEALRGARRRPVAPVPAMVEPARIDESKPPVTGAPLAAPVDTQPLISADNRPQCQPPGDPPTALFGPPTAAEIDALEDGPTLRMSGERLASSSRPDGALPETFASRTSAPGPSRVPRSGKKHRRPIRRRSPPNPTSSSAPTVAADRSATSPAVPRSRLWRRLLDAGALVAVLGASAFGTVSIVNRRQSGPPEVVAVAAAAPGPLTASAAPMPAPTSAAPSLAPSAAPSLTPSARAEASADAHVDARPTAQASASTPAARASVRAPASPAAVRAQPAAQPKPSTSTPAAPTPAPLESPAPAPAPPVPSAPPQNPNRHFGVDT